MGVCVCLVVEDVWKTGFIYIFFFFSILSIFLSIVLFVSFSSRQLGRRRRRCNTGRKRASRAQQN